MIHCVRNFHYVGKKISSLLAITSPLKFFRFWKFMYLRWFRNLHYKASLQEMLNLCSSSLSLRYFGVEWTASKSNDSCRNLIDAKRKTRYKSHCPDEFSENASNKQNRAPCRELPSANDSNVSGAFWQFSLDCESVCPSYAVSSAFWVLFAYGLEVILFFVIIGRDEYFFIHKRRWNRIVKQRQLINYW